MREEKGGTHDEINKLNYYKSLHVLVQVSLLGYFVL